MVMKPNLFLLTEYHSCARHIIISSHLRVLTWKLLGNYFSPPHWNWQIMHCRSSRFKRNLRSELLKTTFFGDRWLYLLSVPSQLILLPFITVTPCGFDKMMQNKVINFSSWPVNLLFSICCLHIPDCFTFCL